jgi:hypothetical protein
LFVDADLAFAKAIVRWWRDSLSVNGIDIVLKSGIFDWYRFGIGHSIPSNL